MMMRMLRFQLSRMVRCREYQVAMLLSTLIVCGAFLAETVTNSKVDRSAILSASEVACGYGISTGWSIFSVLWPFLVVLPFATSFVEDKKNQCINAAVSRGSYETYLGSKVIASGFGSASVVFIPLLVNLLLCYIVFPHNHNFIYASYQGEMYAPVLLGENRLYASYSPTYFLLSLYLANPFLYQFMYLFILGAFSGLCGAAVMAFSFRFSKSKILLFLPLYLVMVISLYARTIFMDAALKSGVRYFDPYICDYLAPLATRDYSLVYFGCICLALLALTCGMLHWAKRHSFRYSQG